MINILLCTIVLGKSMAAIMDPSCTIPVAGTLMFSPEAVNCQNKISNDNCKKFYPKDVDISMPDDREEACWKKQGGNGVDQQMVQVAVASCPRTCGYCCLTPEYNCKNKQDSRIPCSLITMSVCSDPAWRTILVEDCPKTCGLCNWNQICNSDRVDCVDEMNNQSASLRKEVHLSKNNTFLKNY
ncbi:shTK domain protein [Dictyocaulus viviparus]|uniref:ShTK domain protein n=1 Tax=Dictyocaulus viviparus TaxID=29172 RepID=A0A0D8X631_DICVI|nr:shTK domain protein [Dictyocaulus viviparus]